MTEPVEQYDPDAVDPFWSTEAGKKILSEMKGTTPDASTVE